MKSKAKEPISTPLSHTGGDEHLTPEDRANSRRIKVPAPRATHKYSGKNAEERANDRAKANGFK